MSETDKEVFFLELSQSTESLVYVIDEESIDIIKKSDAAEYDFSHLLAIIELSEEDAEFEEIIEALNLANITED